MRPAPRLVISLAALSGCDVRTVQRVMRGQPVRDVSLERVRAAAAQLKIALPLAIADVPTVK